MSYYAVIDTSAFIWDKDGFDDNSDIYYTLADELVDFMAIIKKTSIKILLRDELRDEIYAQFPYEKIDGIAHFREFTTSFIRFFAELGSRIEQFDQRELDDIYAEPNIIYNHYNDAVKKETKYLISEMHQSDDNDIYFTFKATWKPISIKLKTVYQDNSKTYKTIVYPHNGQMEKFFENITPIFEPNPKHDRVKGHKWSNGNSVAKFSCFDGENFDIPQGLLNTAYLAKNGYYYNIDTVYNVYALFYNHRKNRFHGFDVEFDDKDVPEEVNRHFFKNHE